MLILVTCNCCSAAVPNMLLCNGITVTEKKDEGVWGRMHDCFFSVKCNKITKIWDKRLYSSVHVRDKYKAASTGHIPHKNKFYKH